jgi:hypothetical protein
MTAKAVVSEPMSGARRVGEAMTAIAVKPAMVPTAEPDDDRTRPDVPPGQARKRSPVEQADREDEQRGRKHGPRICQSTSPVCEPLRGEQGRHVVLDRRTRPQTKRPKGRSCLRERMSKLCSIEDIDILRSLAVDLGYQAVASHFGLITR